MISTPKKATVVFLHGGPGMDSSYFLPFMEPLGRENRLVFYTQMRGPRIGPEELVWELEEVIQKTALESAPTYLVGHSWGGSLALEYIARNGTKKLRGLVIVGSPYDKEFEERAKETLAGVKPWVPAEGKYSSITLEHLPMLFAPEHFERVAPIYEKVQQDFELQERILGSYIPKFDLKPTLKSIDIPVLNVFGDRDLRVPTDYVRRIQSFNPKQITNVEIAGAAHFPTVEKPEACLHAIREFISRTVQTNRE